MHPLFRSTLLLAAWALLLPLTAAAFDVVPTVSVIELPKNRAGVTLVVRNPRTVALPITVDVVERFVEEDGKERQRPADDLFLVFPPQAVIPPGGSQALRVQWVSAPPQVSRSFTLYATEVPVDLSAAPKSQLQTLLRMGASVHVASAGTQPKPVLLGSSAQGSGVSVTLANEGDRFYYIDSLVLGFGNRRITGSELANAAGRTLVPPGQRRTFLVENVSGAATLLPPQR